MVQLNKKRNLNNQPFNTTSGQKIELAYNGA